MKEETDIDCSKELLKGMIDTDTPVTIYADKPIARSIIKQEEDEEYSKRVLREQVTSEPAQSEIIEEEDIEPVTFIVQSSSLSKDSLNSRHCSICKTTYKSISSYIFHQRLIHRTVAPNMNDPNNYCIVCNKTYKNKPNYQRHLLKVHDKELPEFYSKPKEIDINDENNHCDMCNKTFEDKKKYHNHSGRTHSVVFKVARHKPSQGNNNTNAEKINNYCTICDRTYSDKYEYCKHMSRVHNIAKLKASPGPRYVRRDVTPTIENANNHCTACDKNYTSKRSFRSHLSRIHGISLSKFTGGPNLPPGFSHINRDVTPIIDNINHHCTVCDRSYVDKHTYRKHLLRVHSITIPKDKKIEINK